MKNPLARPLLPSMKPALRWIAVAGLMLALQACAVVAVTGAVVTVVATGVTVTAKAVGAVADAVIPDTDDDD